MQDEFERKQRKKKRDEEKALEIETQSSDSTAMIDPEVVRIREEKLAKAKEMVQK